VRDYPGAWTLHSYDHRRFRFRQLVSGLLGSMPLEALAPREPLPMLTRESDQHTDYHRLFYASFDDLLLDVYERFIAEVIAPEFNGPFCYQSVPTLRVHLADNVAVGEFHRDRDYNHLQGERNYWLPLTPAWDTNTVWIEDPSSGTCRPANAIPGQMVQFDAVNIRHGNYPNDTGATRVSFDFRCIALDDYVETGRTTVNSGRRLVIGDYFKVLGKGIA
jgi:hypothetical protein